jgi:hypothetical protein
MKTNSKWMPTTVLAIVVTLVIATLEPAAFAKDPEDSPKTPPASLPDRPVFKVAQVTAPTQASAAPARTVLPYPAKPKQITSSSKKWIWIIAGAGAAGATAYFLGRGGTTPPPPPAPVVVIGTPVVGQPQ